MWWEVDLLGVDFVRVDLVGGRACLVTMHVNQVCAHNSAVVIICRYILRNTSMIAYVR